METEHTFVCDNCTTVIQDTDTSGVHICPVCGTEMRWDLNIAIHGNYKNPVHSDALAVHPEQRAEHEKMFPNIRLDGQNRPIFDNFVDHHNYLDKTGFVKQRQKTKRKKKILKSNR